VGDQAPRTLLPTQLEVAVLERSRPGRTFRRTGPAELAALLQPAGGAPVAGPEAVAPADAQPTDAEQAGADLPREPGGDAD
jgi:proteasome alpha subunit